MTTLSSLYMQKRHNLLLDLYQSLEKSLGPAHWWPAKTPFEVCIGAILTQNAPWAGVRKAIAGLQEKGIFTVEGIAEADERMLADAVRPAIYHNQKARRIKTFCRFLRDECNGVVEEMRNWELLAARGKLLSLSGIGYETADSMLLYALGMPVFVVDAYTKRILTRHSLIGEECDYEEMRAFFEDALDPDPVLFNEFHALLCLAGAKYCRKKPLCDQCPAREILGEPVL
ncbi:MAG: endonuclease III domain-containing protein [Candidatus Latescibacter sp.]|nr:endonuclease III domain-containing protein [Candidatus Latescibacter sp.]